MRVRWAVTMIVLATALGGCVAKTALDVVSMPAKAVSVATLPARAGGKVIDWTTTSQAEADRNHGRKIRKEEEREGRERRDWEKGCRKRPDAAECRSYTGYRAGQG